MMLLHSTASSSASGAHAITLNGGALGDVLFNPKYAGNIDKVTVAADFLGDILWVCPLSPGTLSWI